MVYALGEIALIMIGILLALQINNWNQNNQESKDEKLLLTRIDNELSANLNKISFLRDGFMNKSRSLKKISNSIKSNNVENDSSFLSNILLSSSFGWTVQAFNRSIYDEILNTGNLQLIGDVELRSSITSLYAEFQQYERVSLPRKSNYTNLVYGVVPMESDLILKKKLNAREVKDIVNALGKLNLDEYIVFEENRTRFLIQIYENLEKSIKALRIQIEAN